MDLGSRKDPSTDIPHQSTDFSHRGYWAEGRSSEAPPNAKSRDSLTGIQLPDQLDDDFSDVGAVLSQGPKLEIARDSGCSLGPYCRRKTLSIARGQGTVNLSMVSPRLGGLSSVRRANDLSSFLSFFLLVVRASSRAVTDTVHRSLS
jgi:hypothetical protein